MKTLFCVMLASVLVAPITSPASAQDAVAVRDGSGYSEGGYSGLRNPAGAAIPDFAGPLPPLPPQWPSDPRAVYDVYGGADPCATGACWQTPSQFPYVPPVDPTDVPWVDLPYDPYHVDWYGNMLPD
jgi:hypothetical protein